MIVSYDPLFDKKVDAAAEALLLAYSTLELREAQQTARLVLLVAMRVENESKED